MRLIDLLRLLLFIILVIWTLLKIQQSPNCILTRLLLLRVKNVARVMKSTPSRGMVDLLMRQRNVVVSRVAVYIVELTMDLLPIHLND